MLTTAVLQKKEHNKSAEPALSHHGDTRVDLKEETSAEVGIPLFLQRFASSSLSTPPPVQRQPEEDKEQLLQTKPVLPLVQREVLEEEEGISQVNSGGSSIQRQIDETDEEDTEENSVFPKLTIGTPNDKYEQEADRVAEKVQRMPVVDSAQGASKRHGQDDVVRAKSKTNIQAKSKGSFTASKKVAKTVRSPGVGNPLPKQVRSRVEPVLGADLGQVKVHENIDANEAAQSINAKAFTHKSDIFLGKGQSSNDVGLMSHEATHTVQQNGAGQVCRTPDDTATPPYSGKSLAIRLNSDNVVERDDALTELSKRTDKNAWKIALLAQESPHPEVRSVVQKIIRQWYSELLDFELFLRNLADYPQGMLSDLAIRTLVMLGVGGELDEENYRNVIRQRITLIRKSLLELEDRLYKLLHGIFPDMVKTRIVDLSLVENLEVEVDILAFADLWETGMRASRMLDRLGIIKVAVNQLTPLQGKVQGELKNLVQSRLIILLTQALQLTDVEDDPVFEKILLSIQEWPKILAKTLSKELYKQFADVKKKLDQAIKRKPLPSFRKAWSNFRAEVIIPLSSEVNELVGEFAQLKDKAEEDPRVVLSRIEALEPKVLSVGERVLYTLQAENMMMIYNQLALTDDAAKDVMLSTEKNLKLLFAFFAQYAHERDINPEKIKETYNKLINSKEFAQVMKNVQDWEKVLQGEMAFAKFLMDVIIVIASIYSAGLAGGILRGLLGRAASMIGKIAIGSAVFFTEVTAFFLTSRGLRWAIYGEEFFGEDFWEEYVKTGLLFAFLRVAWGLFNRFMAPKLPEMLIPAGKFTTTFAAFQAWSVAVIRYDTGEWIGPTDSRFWRLAAHNAVFLAAIYLGLAISKPLTLKITNKLIDFHFKQHNRRCAQLGERIARWTKAVNPDPAETGRLLLIERALFLERAELLRSLYKSNPASMTAEELAYMQKFIAAQISAIDAAQFQSRVRFTPHETDPSIYYYRGKPKEIRKFYEPRGFKFLEIDYKTGRIRMQDTHGEIVNLIRLGKGVQTPVAKPTSAKIILYRGTTYEFVQGSSKVTHDLGPGVYMTYDMELAVLYAQMRRAQVQPTRSGTPGVVLKAEVKPGELGRVLDIYNNKTLRAEWEAYVKTQALGEALLAGNAGAEIYNAYLQNWLQGRGMSLKQFDVIVGPEYIRGGSQVCIRNPSMATSLIKRAHEIARAHEPLSPAYPDVPAPKVK